MGNRQATDKVMVNTPDGKTIPVSIAPTAMGTVIVAKPDGTSVEATVEKVVAPNGVVKTVIIPLKSVYSIDLSSTVQTPNQHGITSGTKTYYLCAAPQPDRFGLFGTEKGKGYITGYATDKEAKCNVVFNGRHHAAEKHNMILDDGKFTWTKTPTNGASYGLYDNEVHPICRISGTMYAGNVFGDKCVASNGSDMYSSTDFEYLDHI